MKAIYVRVSTDEQAEKGYSIDNQIDLCREKAGTDEFLKYVDDGYSGEFLDRPALSKLRDDLKNGLIDEVIVYDPDRLSRKLMNQLIISEEIEKRANLIFVNHDYQKTPEGMLFYQMRGAIAEFEKAKINERMSGGRKRKALDGKVVKNPNMYGYDYDKENSQLVINEKEAEIVRLIFDLFTKPNNNIQGINGIALYLTNQNIPTKKGKSVWHRQVVRQILMNEAYTGRFYHNRWNTEGMLGNKYRPKDERKPMTERPREEWIEISCPAIIEEDVFEHAQRLLAESRRRWAKKSKIQYLLSGLLRCGHCGNTMTGRRQKNWGNYVLEYSDIKNTAGAKNKGCGMRVKAQTLEKEVWGQIKSYIHDPVELEKAANEPNEDNNFEQMEIERLENEINSAKEGRKRMLSLLAKGMDISDEEIREQLADLKEQEKRAERKLVELISKKKESQSSAYSKRLFSEVADYLLRIDDAELTFEDKQMIIRQVVKEIIIYKESIDIHVF